MILEERSVRKWLAIIFQTFIDLLIYTESRRIDLRVLGGSTLVDVPIGYGFLDECVLYAAFVKHQLVPELAVQLSLEPATILPPDLGTRI